MLGPAEAAGVEISPIRSEVENPTTAQRVAPRCSRRFGLMPETCRKVEIPASEHLTSRLPDVVGTNNPELAELTPVA